jgi:hypothetical protein
VKKLLLSALPERLAICRLGPNETVPDWVFATPFWSITRTDEELSLRRVCSIELEIRKRLALP